MDDDEKHISSEGVVSTIPISSCDQLVYCAYLKQVGHKYAVSNGQLAIAGVPVEHIIGITPSEQEIVNGLFLIALYIYWNMGIVPKEPPSLTKGVYIEYIPTGGGQNAIITLFYFPPYTARHSPGATAPLITFLKTTFKEYSALEATYPNHAPNDLMRCMCTMRNITIPTTTAGLHTRMFTKGEEKKTAILSTPISPITLAVLFNLQAEDRRESMTPCIEYILGLKKTSGEVDTQYIEQLPLDRFIMPSPHQAILYTNILMLYSTAEHTPTHNAAMKKIMQYAPDS